MKSGKSIAKNFSILALTFACSTSLTQAAILAKWSFDEESGTTVNDSVGSYHGTLSPSGATFVSGGVSGGAVDISKSLNGYVSMGNVLSLASGDFSLVAWLKMPVGEQTPDSILLGKHASFSRNGYFIHVNQSTGLAMQSANRVFFHQGGSGVGQIQASETPVSTSIVNDGNWHQVVAVYRAGDTKSIYVDGAPAESTKVSQSFLENSVAFLIGGVNEHGIPKSRLNGTVDEVQIYNHALTDADIDYLFLNPTGVVLDCAQKAALLEEQLAAAQTTITNLENQLAAAQNGLSGIDASVQRLEQHFKFIFRNQGFEVKGATTAEAVDNLILGIEKSNRGSKLNLYENLQAQP